jgi:hypothetical protein
VEGWLARGLIRTFTGASVNTLTVREPMEIETFPTHIHAVRVAAGETLRLALNAGAAYEAETSRFDLEFLPDPPPGRATTASKTRRNEVILAIRTQSGEGLTLEKSEDLSHWWDLRWLEAEAAEILYHYVGVPELDQRSFFRWRGEVTQP